MAGLYETAASLRILGDDLDPGEITILLGKKPDRAEKRGQTIHSKSGFVRTVKQGHWSVRAERRRPGNLDAQVIELLAGTSNDIEVWQSITSRFRAGVFCGLFLDEINEGLTVSPTVLEKLGERGIELGLDIYAGPKDEVSED